MAFTASPSFLWKGGDRFLPLLSPTGRDRWLSPLFPPSSGRRWRVAPEVGFALFCLRPTPCPSGIPLPREGGRWFFTAFPSTGKAEDRFLTTFPSFLWKEAARSAGGWLRSLSTSANPRPSGIPLPWEGGRWATHPSSPSFLWKEVARSAGGWLRSFSPSANPLPFGQPPALRASPFHRKGVDGLLIHSSTLHYPFTENGFQILATFIELKMNLKIGQSHYF